MPASRSKDKLDTPPAAAQIGQPGEDERVWITSTAGRKHRNYKGKKKGTAQQGVSGSQGEDRQGQQRTSACAPVTQRSAHVCVESDAESDAVEHCLRWMFGRSPPAL